MTTNFLTFCFTSFFLRGIKFFILSHNIGWGRHVQSVPITTKIVSLNPAQGAVYSIPLYVIKFVSDFLQVRGFLRVFQFPDCNDIIEILLKVALSTLTHYP